MRYISYTILTRHRCVNLHGIVFSCDRVTVNRIWIGNRICALKQLVTTLYKPLSHISWCSQSRSSLCCLVAAANDVASLVSVSDAPVLAGWHHSAAASELNCRSNSQVKVKVKVRVGVTLPRHGPHRRHLTQQFFYCCIT
jgi:hypothetical protein